ncbi:MAG: NAD(P)-dependent oxidoreductase [Acidimicrobiia bacterium]
MSEVGVIGLGIMGSAMSTNLLESGFGIIGYDIDPGKVEALVQKGGRPASSAGEVARAAEVVITSLPGDEALLEVATGPEGLAATGREGLVVVESSTLALATKERARRELAAAGIVLLDCPISGTGAQAARRDISVYASGDPEAVRRARPVLDAIARSTHYVGDFGTGLKLKLIANLLVAIHNVSTAEALVLGLKAGIDPQTVLEVIGDGAGTSRMLEVRGPLMADQRYEEPTARVRMFKKDIQLISAFAAELDCPTPLFSASIDLYASAMSQGMGDYDAAAVCTVLERMAGIERG